MHVVADDTVCWVPKRLLERHSQKAFKSVVVFLKKAKNN